MAPIRSMRLQACVVAGLALLALGACAGAMPQPPPFHPAPAGASVRFLEPADGATVPRAFPIRMEVRGAALQDSGSSAPGAGHFFVLIDEPPIPAGQDIRLVLEHVDYGRKQTEDVFYLPAGRHRLTLQFGDGDHRSYGSAVSDSISVLVAD